MSWNASKYLVPQTLWVLMLASPAWAETINFEVSGQIGASGQYSDISATPLVPNPESADYYDTAAEGFALVRGKLQYQNLSFYSQFRAESEDQESENSIDEAYIEAQLGDSVFAYAGRRILVFGQSYGLNPADILRDPLAENDTYSATLARSLNLGADLAGVDILDDFGGTLSLIYIAEHDNPRLNLDEDIGMLRYAGFLADGAVDYSAAFIGGAREGAALSFSQGIGDASVLYMDATLRRGREKWAISATSPQGHLLLDARETKDLHPFATLGLGHFFENGWSLNIEFSHDAGGYSDKEWAQIKTALNTITPPQSAIEGQALGRLNGVLNHYTLRQNYTFLRLAHDDLFGDALFWDGKVSGEATLLYGLDDDSGSLGARLETALTDNITTGLHFSHKFGSKNAEFKLRPENSTLALYMTMQF